MYASCWHSRTRRSSNVAAQAIYLPKPLPVQCAARFQSAVPISVIMVADDGTFSGTSEAVFFLGLLQNKLQAPPNTAPCQQFYTGTLLGQSVVVAISGTLHSPQLESYCNGSCSQPWWPSALYSVTCLLFRHWTRGGRAMQHFCHRMRQQCQGLHLCGNIWLLFSGK